MKDLRKTGTMIIKGFIGILISIISIIGSIIGFIGAGLTLVSNKIDEGLDIVGERCCRFLEDLENGTVKSEVGFESDIQLDSVEKGY